ncbi:hypothetical protein AQUCO_136900002v1 [Aquilegia coerulea]|uniref:Uncharacterized protein n=1 Tax=Aquilegia coerulea TaxID=218851 RepID=A0A2G5C067_AQUCA|nr:hypothetical protein AQUCO_136900002v1 [Aquilegia coerulea]
MILHSLIIYFFSYFYIVLKYHTLCSCISRQCFRIKTKFYPRISIYHISIGNHSNQFITFLFICRKLI